jgi:hypothetical protein
MPERDKVAVVDERQGSFRVVSACAAGSNVSQLKTSTFSVAGGDGLWYGEDELEDVADSVTELGAKAFEDETVGVQQIGKPSPRR